MEIGRKIYFDNRTGDILAVVGERSGFVRETTEEEDFSAFKSLSERNKDTVDSLQLEYGQYAEDFAKGYLDHIDPTTKQPYFIYPDPANPGEPPTPTPPLTEQLNELKQENANLTKRADTAEANTLTALDAVATVFEQLLDVQAQLAALQGGGETTA